MNLLFDLDLNSINPFNETQATPQKYSTFPSDFGFISGDSQPTKFSRNTVAIPGSVTLQYDTGAKSISNLAASKGYTHLWVYATGNDPYSSSNQIQLSGAVIGVLGMVPIAPTDTIAYTLIRDDLYDVTEVTGTTGHGHIISGDPIIQTEGGGIQHWQNELPAHYVEGVDFRFRDDMYAGYDSVTVWLIAEERSWPYTGYTEAYNVLQAGTFSYTPPSQGTDPSYFLGGLGNRYVSISISVNGITQATVSGQTYNKTQAGYALGLGYFFWTNCGWDLSFAQEFDGLTTPITDAKVRSWLSKNFHYYLRNNSASWDPVGQVCCCDDTDSFVAQLRALPALISGA